MTKKWRVTIDGGSGGYTEIEAETAREALERAIEWARGGDWDSPYLCHVHVRSEDDEEAEKYVGVGGCPYRYGCGEIPWPCRMTNGWCPAEERAAKLLADMEQNREKLMAALDWDKLSRTHELWKRMESLVRELSP